MMEPSTIEAGLDLLVHGDGDVAEQVFRTYEPYLRMVVRRNLRQTFRSKMDSSDVVQSVWSDLLSKFRDGRYRFSDAAHLRGFLVKATRDRLVDRNRRYRTASRLERPLDDSTTSSAVRAAEATPAQVAEADELWARLIDLCPPAHREIVEMKRKGAPLPSIAERVGMHPSSVRRVLSELARRLAEDSA